RISPGLSQKIEIRIAPGDSTDWFILARAGDKPLILANSNLSAAAGLFNYLSDYCHARPGWMQPRIDLPAELPLVTEPVAHRCRADLRYYLNYCTYSYSMPFWSWERWQQEIDWMALHGINMPLAIEGTATVWRNTLRRLGYPEESIDRFVAGPAFQAWWLMNNLEGWGGPVSEAYYERQSSLQQRILAEMRAWGMEPVLPGYSGMIPHDASSTLGIPTADGGSWLGFTRPAVILPTSPDFDRVADIYYEEQARLYGSARYYSMDPFHEGGSTEGLDLNACGLAIYQAMERHAPGSVWLLQGWQENPRSALLGSLPDGAAMLLDLQAENEPMWRKRTDIFSRRPWIYCMLLNFGGNEGLYGKTDALVAGYVDALAQSPTLCGVGLTMEAIGNNPVMYDLLTELPWISDDVKPDSLIHGYVRSSYGTAPDSTLCAWRLLMKSVYNSPADSSQQGTTESLFCARPADRLRQASAWANVKDYYDPRDVIRAAYLM
ncbi:MAG: alpha-N-acetylglucosaminidase, partial [Paramuribaculum sp.]|nr:alpha-N-acetylglucosaminidase [Paramuribaculum sp.]